MSLLPRYDEVNVGDALPEFETPPLTRHTLALYCGASGDHNPIHVDSDFAKSAGMPDVFAHGMLGMAWMCRLLTQWAPQKQLRKVDARFAGITQVGHVITCRGKVAEIVDFNGERCARIEISTSNQYGQVRIAGEALVALA